jgi:hypothetical protein
MADEQKPKGRKKEPKAEGGLLVEKAEKVAPPAPVPAPAKKPPKPKIPKLQKKNKSRLPRRQKKALQKTNAARTKA